MTTGAPARVHVSRVALLTVLVVAATLLGGWRVVSMLSADQSPMTLRVGDASFTVTHVEQVAGLSDAQLGGMSHGVQSLVSDDKALVRVAVTVTAGDAPASYDASVLRAFASGSPDAIAPLSGSLPRGRLGAHGRIEGSLSYVVPRNGAQLVLRAGQLDTSIPLLQVDDAPAGAGDHPHTTGATTSGTSPPSRP